MQFIKESMIYRFFHKLFLYYLMSQIKKIFIWFANIYRQSILDRCIQNVVQRESSMDDSLFVRFVKTLYKFVDRFLMCISRTFSRCNETSLVTGFFRGIKKVFREKLFALVFPIFGVGYLAGRILYDRWMIRDIILLGVLFIAAAIWLLEWEKLKTFLKNSLVYRIYQLMLE